MNTMQMTAANNLLETISAYNRELGEGELRMMLCESCKGDLFDVAADYLIAVGLVRSTIVRMCDCFAPALVLA